MAEQRSKADPKDQAALLYAQAQLTKLHTQKVCSDKLQALAAATRPVLESKQFVYNKNSVTFSDGNKTLVYGENGLTSIDGLSCTYDRTQSVRDGLQQVFNSTLPKVAPSDLDIKNDPAAHRERLKQHLDTLHSCQSVMGVDYVAEITKKYHMIETLNPKVPPAGTR